MNLDKKKNFRQFFKWDEKSFDILFVTRVFRSQHRWHSRPLLWSCHQPPWPNGKNGREEERKKEKWDGQIWSKTSGSNTPFNVCLGLIQFIQNYQANQHGSIFSSVFVQWSVWYNHNLGNNNADAFSRVNLRYFLWYYLVNFYWQETLAEMD